jgi:hypothetical protein
MYVTNICDYVFNICSLQTNSIRWHCNMNAFFSFDLFMVYIPECKKLRTMK